MEKLLRLSPDVQPGYTFIHLLRPLPGIGRDHRLREKPGATCNHGPISKRKVESTSRHLGTPGAQIGIDGRFCRNLCYQISFRANCICLDVVAVLSIAPAPEMASVAGLAGTIPN